jgi:hypothetical protein
MQHSHVVLNDCVTVPCLQHGEGEKIKRGKKVKKKTHITASTQVLPRDTKSRPEKFPSTSKTPSPMHTMATPATSVNPAAASSERHLSSDPRLKYTHPWDAHGIEAHDPRGTMSRVASWKNSGLGISRRLMNLLATLRPHATRAARSNYENAPQASKIGGIRWWRAVITKGGRFISTRRKA